MYEFQIQGEQLFSWVNKEGLERAMTLPVSACDNNDPIWKVDTLKVSDKGKLPIKVSTFQKLSFIKSPLTKLPNSNLNSSELKKSFPFKDTF